MHFEEESGTAAHCLRLHLGSLAESKYNTPCTHKHPNPKVHVDAPDVHLKQTPSTTSFVPTFAGTPEAERPTVRETLGQFLDGHDLRTVSATCTQYRREWAHASPESLWYAQTTPPECTDEADKCTNASCAKKATLHCTHCVKSLCRAHCAEEICTCEELPKDFGERFVCTTCSPTVEACTHSAVGCATCDELQFFKQDLMKCANLSKDEQIIGQARDVCKSIDIMVGHTARTKNQERYWPDLLDKLRENKEYDHVLLKSDYWKKFEGTVMKQGKTFRVVCPCPQLT